MCWNMNIYVFVQSFTIQSMFEVKFKYNYNVYKKVVDDSRDDYKKK